MPDIDRALADIASIRSQLARGERFFGFGPAAMAATGGLAAIVAGLQCLFAPDAGPLAYFTIWIATAVVAATIASVELVTRSRRFHSQLADEMIATAVADFLPAGGAGMLLLAVFARFTPEAVWMLPGLWQVLVSLGLFAASRSLPRAVSLVAAFYLVAGLATLMWASTTHVLTPALMGVPFTIGQLGFALVLHLCLKADHAEA